MKFLFLTSLFLSFIFTHGMQNDNKSETEQIIDKLTVDTNVELEKDIVWTGWICNEGPNWDHRWFQLHENGNFEYYDENGKFEMELKGQGNILMGYTNFTKKRFRIVEFHAQRLWIFQFTKDADMEFWIQFCTQISRFSKSISIINKRFNEPLSKSNPSFNESHEIEYLKKSENISMLDTSNDKAYGNKKETALRFIKAYGDTRSEKSENISMLDTPDDKAYVDKKKTTLRFIEAYGTSRTEKSENISMIDTPNDEAYGKKKKTALRFIKAYGASRTACVDQNENCASWSSIGECEENPGYMLVSCPFSCNMCVDENIGDHDHDLHKNKK